MSHNNVKVGASEPNRQGQISQALGDLSDVSASSPSTGDTLRFNDSSSRWETGGAATQMALFGTGQSVAYPTGGSAISTNVDLEFYGRAYDGVGATGTYTGWFNSITLPAGEYILTAVSGISMSASTGEVSYRWYDQAAGAYLGTTGIVGDDDLDVGSPCIAYVDPTSATAYSVRVTAASNVNTLASQGNRAGERSFIEVRKM